MPQVSYNDVRIVEDLAKRFNFNTPDYLDRKQEHTIPFFVYDNFKIGGEMNFILQGMPYLGEARSVMDCFQMEQCSHTGMPLVRKLDRATTKTPMGSVLGDMFVIDPTTLCEMDKIVTNTKMYTRALHWFWLEDQPNPMGKKIKTSLKAWVYLKNPEFWQNRSVLGRFPIEKNCKRVYNWPVNKTNPDIIPWI